MRKTYPSDITRAEFARIEPDLEAARMHTKPRSLDLYDVFCGLLYVLRSGCQWRMLPEGFPKWRSVYSYFEIWKSTEAVTGDMAPSVLEQVLKKISWRYSYFPWEERTTKSLCD